MSTFFSSEIELLIEIQGENLTLNVGCHMRQNWMSDMHWKKIEELT